MSRRRTTDEERDLFRTALTGPGSVKKPRAAKPPTRKAYPASVSSGLDGRTGDRLDRGILTPDVKLDLHGMTEAAAHRALTMFVHKAQECDARLLLVVTGKGAPAAGGPFDLGLAGRRRGVLKAMVPRWLCEPPLAQQIADIRTAHRRHGGEGALYVYLRKSNS